MAESKSTAADAAPAEAPLTNEAKALRDADIASWSTWIAAEDISYGSVLAYAKGHPVPTQNVEAHGYDEQGLVVKRGTKAADAVLAEIAAR